MYIIAKLNLNIGIYYVIKYVFLDIKCSAIDNKIITDDSVDGKNYLILGGGDYEGYNLNVR